MDVPDKGGFHPPSRGEQRRSLKLALVINAVLFVAELAGALVFGSLALMADAAHMFSDVIGLGAAILAHGLVERPSTHRHTYGLQRAEVMGALANGVLLMIMAVLIVIEGVQRLTEPPEVVGLGVLGIAVVGLAINLASAAVISQTQGESLNMRGALIHMLGDAAGSAGAILAGAAILLWNAHWADPLISVLIAGLIAWTSVGLLRETVHVLLEGTPKGMSPVHVVEAMSDDPAVESVHHLHLWNLASDVPALSAHIVLSDDMALHDAQGHGDRLKKMLTEEFGIKHATLEFECHACEPGYETERAYGHR